MLTNIEALYGVLARYPINIIKYWIMLSTWRNSLEHRLFLLFKDDCNKGNNYSDMNWAKDIKRELYSCRFSDIWANRLQTDLRNKKK